MARYRFARFPGLHSGAFEFGCTFAQTDYIELSADLRIDGWLVHKAPEAGNVNAVRLMIVSTRRRAGEATTKLTYCQTTAGQQQTGAVHDQINFSLDAGDLPEVRQGIDFALEIQACVGKRWRHLQTVTFVRDEWRQGAIFVVGSPRSGTTIIGDSIRKTLGAGAGFGESHLLPLAGAIAQTVQEFHRGSAASRNPNMLLNHVNPHLMGEQMQNVIKQQYANLFGDQCVVDKTPGGAMIWALPDIQRLWPDARVIFAKRRGIENIVSRLKKFPDIDFEAHCQQWRNCMNAWQQVRSQLHHTLEIDQFDVLTQPQACAERLSDFLSLTTVQAQQLSLHLQNDRPEKTGHSKALEVLDLDQVEWSNAQKALFRSTCESDLERWGYSLDRNYYLAANS